MFSWEEIHDDLHAPFCFGYAKCSLLALPRQESLCPFPFELDWIGFAGPEKGHYLVLLETYNSDAIKINQPLSKRCLRRNGIMFMGRSHNSPRTARRNGSKGSFPPFNLVLACAANWRLMIRPRKKLSTYKIRRNEIIVHLALSSPLVKEILVGEHGFHAKAQFKRFVVWMFEAQRGHGTDKWWRGITCLVIKTPYK